MGIEVINDGEIDRVSGAGGKGGLIKGCINGAFAGYTGANPGYGAYGAGAGCLAGGSVGMAGGGSEAQAVAGYLAGAAFGPYGGSSTSPQAANYENSFDRQDSARRMSST